MQIYELISEQAIHQKVKEVAQEINTHYKDKVSLSEPLIIIGVLKGAYLFLADLVRALDIPVQIEFVRLSSYGGGTHSSGVVKAPDLTLPASIHKRHILIVEDIVDTGRTAEFFIKYLNDQFTAQSIKLASLLDKPSRRVIENIQLDYCCFSIEDVFVLGYGLDYDELYRELPYIGYIKDLN